MPLLLKSSYKPVSYYLNGHLETILPSTFRKIENINYQRERLELADGDFLDLDWLQANNPGLVIISHGLEGSSHRHYVKGMARYFHENKWDVLAWNCRSCSGEINRLPRLYHHAASEDLNAVIVHAIKSGKYTQISLVGFSMGGSLSLKYLGENKGLPAQIKSCIVFSVPCDLKSSAEELDRPKLRFYRNRFLRKLERKIKSKAAQFPDRISDANFNAIKTFNAFDDRYTAPLHGFKNAGDFYHQASANQYIPQIEVPTLIVNAENDPFLPEACYPTNLAQDHPYVFLEIPKRGGHVGFPLSNQNESWMEIRALNFANSY